MKSVVLFSALLFSLSLLAAGNLDTSKEKFTNHLKEYSASIQMANACTTSAQDKDTLKACKDAFQKDLKDLNAKYKAKQLEKLDDKIERLEER